MNILGINAVFHDSAACLIQNGQLVAAVEEERFTRIKKHKTTRPFHAALLPFQSIAYCLEEGGITLADVDHIAYSFDPTPLINGSSLTLKPQWQPKEYGFDPWHTVFLAGATSAPRLLLDDIPWALKSRFYNPSRNHNWQFHFLPHHLTHAASAFFPSPFSEAAVMTIDGQGGDATTAFYVGTGNELTLLHSVNLPHSLGLLYENLTAYLGFQPSSDEFKVMALAAFGQPRYLEQVLSCIEVQAGTYTLKPIQFNVLCGPPRERNGPLNQTHYDLACSVQKALEITVLSLAEWLRQQTGLKALCLAGGVAMNCVLNGVLKKQGSFEQIWVPPAAGDAGTALGAALFLAAQLEPAYKPTYSMTHAFLGPGFTDPEIETLLKEAGLSYHVPDDLTASIAKRLADGEIIGWFQGRMELGARALGNRSILASPALPSMQQRLNRVKGRESFRPVAAIVLVDKVADWFEFEGPAPFMNFVAAVRPEKKEWIRSAVHTDDSSRIQTVDAETNPLLYELITEFEVLTDIPMLINTSFNTRGEPVVCTPRDAISCFFTSGLDTLVIGPFVLTKSVPDR